MVSHTLVVVVGMVREAKIVTGKGVKVLIGGGQSMRLSREIEQAISPGVAGVVSFGLCGALHPTLDAGDVVVESDDTEWLGRLRAAVPDAYPGSLLGSEVMIATVSEKTRLFRDTGADAVDMESHIVKTCARKAGVPFAIVRSVSDAADHALPTSVLAGMKADGRTNLVGVLTALARRPWELPALLRTASDAQRAFEALTTVRTALGPRFGCPRLADAL